MTSYDSQYLDKIWEFINTFNFMTVTCHEYRDQIINRIRNKYTIDEFYEYELSVEKLYWNLRSKLFEVIYKHKFDYIMYDKKMNIINCSNMELAKIKLNNTHYFRSYINKIINKSDIDSNIYFKRPEGTIDIFEQIEFNRIIGYIMTNRILYDQIIKEPNSYKQILELPPVYRQFEYGFPNLNLCRQTLYSDETRRKRIKKMYYEDSVQQSENNWFVLL
jgi:hypothetical protein